jgi:GTP cyclohydrolase II
VAEVHGSLLREHTRPFDSRHGRFELHVFRNLGTRRPMLALTLGDVRGQAPLLVRVHSSCVTSETFGACDCDCADQLEAALACVAEEGRGVVFYLLQEGRGAGLAAKARDRMIVQASGHRITTFEAYDMMGLGRDLRRYEEVAFASKLLRIGAPLRVLSNNPDKLAALESIGLDVEEGVPLFDAASAFNAHYIASKSEVGHTLSHDGLDAADLPEPVRCFDPYALPDRPSWLHLASYLLPIRPSTGAPAWFRLHLHLDRAAQREVVVLTRFADRDATAEIRVERDVWVERLVGGDTRRWPRAAEAIVAAGSGCAVFLPLELNRGSEGALDAATATLLAYHLGSRPARLLELDDEPASLARHAEALTAAGANIEQRAVRAGVA